MDSTIVYLIRHAETIDETGIRNTDEIMQEINEKEILKIWQNLWKISQLGPIT